VERIIMTDRESKLQAEAERMRTTPNLPLPGKVSAEEKLRELEAITGFYLARLRERRARWERESQEAEEAYLREREASRER
jgi:hypothetical protein